MNADGEHFEVGGTAFESTHAEADAAYGKWRSWHMVIWRNERPFTACAAEDLDDWVDEAIKQARSGRACKPMGEKRVSR